MGMDARTLEIRAIEVTDDASGAAPRLPQPTCARALETGLHAESATGVDETSSR